jgi:hypothetical protein
MVADFLTSLAFARPLFLLPVGSSGHVEVLLLNGPAAVPSAELEDSRKHDTHKHQGNPLFIFFPSFISSFEQNGCMSEQQRSRSSRRV